MDEFEQKISGVRLYVLLGSVIGLAIVLIVAFARDSQGFGLNDIAFVAIFGGPFLLALLSLLIHRVEQQRWVWLVCALLAAAVGLPLIFSGVGFFLLAIAICFGWAFATTRQRHLESSR